MLKQSGRAGGVGELRHLGERRTKKENVSCSAENNEKKGILKEVEIDHV